MAQDHTELSETQIAEKLVRLRRAQEDYETARDMMRESEQMIADCKRDLKPYLKMFADEPKEALKAPRIKSAHLGLLRNGKPRVRAYVGTRSARRVDYGALVALIRQAGGHVSRKQFMRLAHLPRKAQAANQLYRMVQQGLLVKTQGSGKDGVRAIWNIPGTQVQPVAQPAQPVGGWTKGMISPTRQRVIDYLHAQTGVKHVREIGAACQLKKDVLSYHLSTMKKLGQVTNPSEGFWIATEVINKARKQEAQAS